MAAIFVHVKRAVNLRSADFMGKSDPYVRFDFATDLTTSVIDNNNNPQWDECFLVADDGRTPLHFTVFDSDAGVVVDGSDDFLGECVVDQTNVPADGRWHALSAHLTGKKAKGSLELAVCRWPAGATLNVKVCRAFGLKNADGMFGKSDPYARIIGLLGQPPAMRDDAVWGTTRVRKNDLNPVFDETFACDVLARFAQLRRRRQAEDERVVMLQAQAELG